MQRSNVRPRRVQNHWTAAPPISVGVCRGDMGIGSIAWLAMLVEPYRPDVVEIGETSSKAEDREGKITELTPTQSNNASLSALYPQSVLEGIV